MSLLHPVMTEDNTCVLELPHATQQTSGTWEGESGFYEQEILLTIHQNVTSLTVEVSEDGRLMAGRETTVTCSVEGGSPQPDVTFMLMEDENEIEVSTQDHH